MLEVARCADTTLQNASGNSLTEWGPSTLSPSLINRQSGGLSAPEAIWDHKEGKVRAANSGGKEYVRTMLI